MTRRHPEKRPPGPARPAVAACRKQMHRVAGRYTQLNRSSPPPVRSARPTRCRLWEIRARRVVHDAEERQLYFDHAQFRIAGLPVFYLPRLRMPDPTLDRATGLLCPRSAPASDLGFGVQDPLFHRHRRQPRPDAACPGHRQGHSASLGLRYRQAFANGDIEIRGALSRDRLTARTRRGYLFADGAFALPDDFRLTFGVQVASDNAYLLDYDISDSDRLESVIELSSAHRTQQLFRYRNLQVQVAARRRRQQDPALACRQPVADPPLDAGPHRGAGYTLIRRSQPQPLLGDSFDANADGVTDGRDMTRADSGRGLAPTGARTNGIGPLALARGLTGRRLLDPARTMPSPSPVTRMTPWPSPTSAGPGSSPPRAAIRRR
jgi:LPS-assembly protein